jgi:hypothetical protein
MAHLLNAASPDEIAFDPSMTRLTLGISRALAREIGSRHGRWRGQDPLRVNVPRDERRSSR